VILRWEQGRSTVDALLARGQLTRVAPNSELAKSMLHQARAHLTSAALVVENDPTGAFVLAYDSARKTLAAILVNQGLRAGGDGAHTVLLDVVLAQLDRLWAGPFGPFPGCVRCVTTPSTPHPTIPWRSRSMSLKPSRLRQR
jgi:hypothetical protein